MNLPFKMDVVAIDAKGDDDIFGIIDNTILIAQNVTSHEANRIVARYKTIYYKCFALHHPNGVKFVNIGKKHKIIPQ